MSKKEIKKEDGGVYDETAGNIIYRYILLLSVRNQGGFDNKLSEYIEKSQLTKKPGERYKTFLSRAVSDQQKAELLHNNPIFDFIPLDDNARSNVFTLKEAWKYWWKVDETDSKIYDVVSDSADFGSGFLYTGYKVEYRKVNFPRYDKVTKSIIFEEKEVEQYFGVYSEYIRIEDIYFDGETIEHSNECIWRKFRSKKDYIKAHENNSMYFGINDENIPSYSIFLASNPKLPQTKKPDYTDLLVEMIYYNKSKDEHVILANGKVVYKNPIPHTHKELPFVKYDNHIYRNRLIQMGNYELLEDVEEYLDKLRQQTIDVTKANIGFNIIEKDGDFDPQTYKIGVNDFIELENPDAIKHFSANIQAGGLTQLQQSGQEDTIVLSGVDYRSQLIQSGETATKTSSKNASQLKRINLILKRNSFKFYNRLAKLRLSDLQFIHSMGNFTIPLKGLHNNSEGFTKLQDGYGTFTIEPKMLEGKFNVAMQTESLLGDSTEDEKNKYLQFFQIFGNLVGNDKKPIMNRVRMVEIAGQKIGVDTDVLLEKELASQSGEDMINGVIQSINGQGDVGNNSNNPNFIPPENRANNDGGVQVLGGGNINPNK